MRSSKFYCHICTLEGRAIKILLIVDIDNAYYFMTATERYFFYHTAHLAVSYQCYFHFFVYILVRKSTNY